VKVPVPTRKIKTKLQANNGNALQMIHRELLDLVLLNAVIIYWLCG